jgi:predicted dehydrogenase
VNDPWTNPPQPGYAHPRSITLNDDFMNQPPRHTRRDFLKTSSALAASAPFLLPSSVWSAGSGPNDRITLGFIGVGTQGRHLLNSFLPIGTCQVLAVCDVDTTRRAHHQKLVNDFYTTKADRDHKGCEAYEDFRVLLQRKDIDAVVIATPDHWHEIPVVMAARAEKDIYCEKPLSLTIAEARRMADAVRRHGRIFQTGSMQRSMSEFHKACELVRNGRIGQVKTIHIGIGGPPKWCDLPEEPMEPGLDWDFWLGPAPKRPYNSVLSPRGVHQHFPNWRAYREYSGGMMTDWGAHHFDIAQWGLGMDASGPVDIIPPSDPKAESGLRYRYANGVEMIHGNPKGGGVLFTGTEGTVFVDRGKLETQPETLKSEKIPDSGVRLYKSNNHYNDFLQAMRSRKPPICDVEVGCRSVTVCHLGNLAYLNHRRLQWDPAKEQFVGDAEANQWLDPRKRAPWDKAV